MNADLSEQRKAAALRAINAAFGTADGEFGATLFVSHHLEELEPAYWLETFGTAKPDARQILNALVLVGSWSSGDHENIDTFDFGLPGDVSHYLLSVRFDDDGEVLDVSMES